MTTESAAATAWASGPLHEALIGFLPTFTKEPFSPAPRLNIPQVKEAIGKSHETVYKWLRTSRLSPANARALVNLANSDSNKAVLAQLGRTPPKIEDFSRFVFATV